MAKLRMKPLVAYSCPPTRTEGFDLQKAQPMEDDDEGEEQKAQPNEDDDDDEGEEQKAQPNEEDKKGWTVDFGNPHVSCLNESITDIFVQSYDCKLSESKGLENCLYYNNRVIFTLKS